MQFRESNDTFGEEQYIFVSTFFAIKGLASPPTDTVEDLTICGFLFHCRCLHCGCGPYTHGQSKWFSLHSFCHDIRFHSHSRYVLGAQWVSFAHQMGEPHLKQQQADKQCQLLLHLYSLSFCSWSLWSCEQHITGAEGTVPKGLNRSCSKEISRLKPFYINLLKVFLSRLTTSECSWKFLSFRPFGEVECINMRYCLFLVEGCFCTSHKYSWSRHLQCVCCADFSAFLQIYQQGTSSGSRISPGTFVLVCNTEML